MEKRKKSKVMRTPKRAVYDRKIIYDLLDSQFHCHIGIIQENYPVVIPVMYGRKGDNLYIHGASVSRLITEMEKGIKICISIANVSGLVLARSAFHHSLNYESVVIFGLGELVSDEEKVGALKIISDHLIPGRWEEVRKPNAKELKATKVIKITIEEASAKIRTGGPKDDKPDLDLEVWAGILPIQKSFGKPVRDPHLKYRIQIPESIRKLTR
jgi:nitroimidazol reductase NimA-like FMN-containing flavoprotein (pyridoxamine 5'-phosphate oxidase superfamily)